MSEEWTPPSDAVEASGGWTPPADAVETQKKSSDKTPPPAESPKKLKFGGSISADIDLSRKSSPSESGSTSTPEPPPEPTPREKFVTKMKENALASFRKNPEFYNDPKNRDYYYSALKKNFDDSEIDQIRGKDKPTPFEGMGWTPMSQGYRKNPIDNQDQPQPLPETPLIEKPAERLASGTAEQISGGAGKVEEAGAMLEKNPYDPKAFLRGAVGMGKMALGVLTMTNPEVAAFMTGTNEVSRVSPTIAKVIGGPTETDTWKDYKKDLEKKYTDAKIPIPTWINDGEEVTSFLWGLGLFGLAGKGLKEAKMVDMRRKLTNDLDKLTPEKINEIYNSTVAEKNKYYADKGEENPSSVSMDTWVSDLKAAAEKATAAEQQSDAKKLAKAQARKVVPDHINELQSITPTSVVSDLPTGLSVNLHGQDGHITRSDAGEIVFDDNKGNQTIIGGGGDTRSLDDAGIISNEGVYQDKHGSYFVEKTADGPVVYKVDDKGKLTPAYENDKGNAERKAAIVKKALAVSDDAARMKTAERKQNNIAADIEKTDDPEVKQVLEGSLASAQAEVNDATTSIADNKAADAHENAIVTSLTEAKDKLAAALGKLSEDGKAEMEKNIAALDDQIATVRQGEVPDEVAPEKPTAEEKPVAAEKPAVEEKPVVTEEKPAKPAAEVKADTTEKTSENGKGKKEKAGDKTKGVLTTPEAPPAEPSTPVSEVKAPIEATDVKTRKAPGDAGEFDGVHQVVHDGKVIGEMYYDRSLHNAWVDNNHSSSGPNDIVGEVLGDNKAEAVQKIVDKYNESKTQENATNQGTEPGRDRPEHRGAKSSGTPAEPVGSDSNVGSREAPKEEKAPAPEQRSGNEVTGPKEGDKVELEPQMKGFSPRKMVYEKGEWKQQVGNETTGVGEAVRTQAQAEFDKGNVEAGKELTPKEKAQKELLDARIAFRKAGGMQFGGLQSTPEFLNLIRAYIKAGYHTAKEFIAKFREDHPDEKLSDEDLAARFNEAKTSNPATFDITPHDEAHVEDLRKDDVEKRVVKGKTVSTRVPSAKSAPADIHSQTENFATLEEQRKSPKNYLNVANVISGYDQIKGQVDPKDVKAIKKGLLSRNKGGSDALQKKGMEAADRVYKAFVDHVKGNLLWLHDSVNHAVRQVSERWYDGANVMAQDLAKKYNMAVEQAAGVMAALSPQMDWYKNISLAQRVIDIVKTKSDFVIDQKMIDKYIELSAKGQKGKNESVTAFKRRIKEQIRQAKTMGPELLGKKMSEDRDFYPQMLRAYDEAYNDKSYDVYSPNGDVIGTAKNKPTAAQAKKGQPGNNSKVGWQGYDTIAKAISIAEDGSAENISKNLGGEHKVRSFNNNISDPNSPDNHSTIDTHAVAAGLLEPLAGSSQKVKDNLSGLGSAETGIAGTYPALAEAYKQAAQERGILPRQMQSITWEAVRGLFTADFKTAENKGVISDIWKDYAKGKIDIHEARNRINNAAGGIEIPSWAKSSNKDALEVGGSDQPANIFEPGALGDGRPEDTGGGGQGEAEMVPSAAGEQPVLNSPILKNRVAEGTSPENFMSTIKDKLNRFADDNSHGIIDFVESVLPKKYQEKYKNLYEAAARVKIDANVDRHTSPGGVAASYGGQALTFYMKNVDFAHRNWDNFAESVNHEIIHGLVDFGVNNDFEFHQGLKDVHKKVVDNFVRAPQDVKDIISYITDTSNKYPRLSSFKGATAEEMSTGKWKKTKNLEELVTFAFSNKNFAKFLDSIPMETEGGGNKTIFDHLKDIVRKAIGKVVGGKTALDKINDTVNKYFDPSFRESDMATRNKEYGWGLKTEMTKTEKSAKRLEDAGAAFYKKSAQASFGGPLNAIPEFIEYAKAFVDHAGNKVEDFIKKIREDFPSLTHSDEELRTAFEDATKKEEPPVETPPPAEPTNPTPEPAKTIGVAERLHPEHVSGGGLSAEAHVTRGRELITNDNYSQENLVKRFNDNNREYVSSKDYDAARAHYEVLEKEANRIADEKGEDSPEYEAAKEKSNQWLRTAVEPMTNTASDIFRGAQGETEIDTGSFTALAQAIEKASGKKATPKQVEQAKVIAKNVKQKQAEVQSLQKQLTDTIDKELATEEKVAKKTYTERAKKVADTFRKLKTKPFVFTDSNGNAIQVHTMGLSWNDAVEAGAKAIETSGKIADGVSAVIEKIKDADWYTGLNEKDKNAFHDQLEQHYLENSAEGKKVAALQTRLNNLKEGKVNQGGVRTPDSPEATRLKEEIRTEREKMGLVPSRELPEPGRPTPIKAEPPKPMTPEEKLTELASRFAGKKDNAFATKDVKDIWNYAKENYIGRNLDYDTMLSNIGTDLGLTTAQVRHAFAQPKGARAITNAMYKAQSARNYAQNRAKQWVKDSNKHLLSKLATGIPRAFFEEKILGHFGVLMTTHAGANLANPAMWKPWFKNFGRQYKFAFSEAAHEQAKVDLQNSPNYITARRAGLANEPNTIYDDYGIVKKLSGKLGRMGDQATLALKTFRQDFFDHYYDKASDAEKADPQFAKDLASLANNASGTAGIKPSSLASVAVFAPNLIVSRWNRMIVQPVKAVSTFVQHAQGKASPGELAAAKIVAKRAGTMLAATATALAVNQALLSATGSSQNINTTDPSKPDWMKFKIGDKTIDPSGGIISTWKFLGSLLQVATSDKKERHGESEQKALLEKGADYVRGTLSPIAGTTIETLSSHDFSGNTFPWSNEPPDHKYNHKMTWKEYLWYNAPIPIAEGAKDVYMEMEKKNIPQPQIEDVFTGVWTGMASGFTGVRVGVVPKEHQEKKLHN